MIRFATLNELRSISKEPESIEFSKKAHELYGKTVFLSHSSADHDSVPGVVRILEGHGGRVYVDDRDSELNALDMHEKAQRLRKVVNSCRKLVLFITPNSKESQWVTWELALGDGINTPENVVLFPSADTMFETKWSEREYLGIYRRIVWGNFQGSQTQQWMVLDHRDYTGTTLGEWLK